MKETFSDYISDGGRYLPFAVPATEELTGRTARFPDGQEVCFRDETAVKCDDDLFLAEKDGKILLVEELPDGSLMALDAEETTEGAAVLPEELEGWETDLSFASGRVLTAAFGDGTLTLRPSPEPAASAPFTEGDPLLGAREETAGGPAAFVLKAARTGEKRFLLRFPETGETVFLNARRFLFYAVVDGRITAGFADVPPRTAG
ncbi:MAG: hypothetical protein IK082_12515 [Oscillospiraceae bacterium]|nr:hypothetical protein [Oscillospiraceae bacterium]